VSFAAPSDITAMLMDDVGNKVVVGCQVQVSKFLFCLDHAPMRWLLGCAVLRCVTLSCSVPCCGVLCCTCSMTVCKWARRVA
jgi:hypothetical protein